MTHSPTLALVVNALGFQAVWFAWALGAPQGEWALPALVSVIYLSQHWRWSPQRRADAHAVLACVVIGGLFDTAMMQAQWLSFSMPNPEPLQTLQPFWMAMLWACLACTVHSSLRWLHALSRWAYPVSGVFGFFAYEAASHLGALTRADNLASVLALLVFWAVFLPWVQRWSQARA
jgi:hypothetical protein